MPTLSAQTFEPAHTLPVPVPLHAVDQARADFYALLASMFLGAPQAPLLDALADAGALAAGPGEQVLAAQWEGLTQAAAVVDEAAVAEEYDALFVSTGNPLLNPYGSLYLCGYMNDKPVAALRGDLARLGLGRAAGAGELEDHIGVLFETMRVLVAGGPGIAPQPLEVQRDFFSTHLASWSARFLADLDAAAPANFYRVVGACAAAFLAVETAAFALGAGQSFMNEAADA